MVFYFNLLCFELPVNLYKEITHLQQTNYQLHVEYICVTTFKLYNVCTSIVKQWYKCMYTHHKLCDNPGGKYTKSPL